MIVVSDTGPIHYLVLTDRIEWLPLLFARILIPESVRRELLATRSPEKVRTWITDFPIWIEVKEPAVAWTDPDPRIGPGEASAIALASETGTTLLCDDLYARVVAERRGVGSTGTLGVLTLGHRQGLGDIGESLEALAKTNFRRSVGLFEEIARRAREG